MRVLTTYELDLVAGGFGSTDDAQINGVGGPHGNGSGYGGGGGGGGDAYSSGSWVHLPPASYFGNYPRGGNGTWVWLPSGGGGGAGGNSGAGGESQGNHIRLGGDPCPVAHAEAYQALASLQKSPTAAGLLAKANAAGLEVILNRNHQDSYDPGLGYGFVSWDPYSAASGRNEDGSYWVESPTLGLIHEIVHWSDASLSAAGVHAIVNQVARELNANTGTRYGANRGATSEEGSAYLVADTDSTAFDLATVRPTCGT